MYEKEYEQVSKSKSEGWKKKNDYENFKEFKNYANKIKDEETGKRTDEKTDITWIHRSKNDFNNLLNKVSRYQTDGLRTKAGDKTITLGNTKNFLKDIITGRVKNREEAKSEYLKTVFKDNDLLKETAKRYTDSKKELRDIFNDVKYTIFGLDDINEQPDTTDMPEETEEYAA